jgi:hypothetical protein
MHISFKKAEPSAFVSRDNTCIRAWFPNAASPSAVIVTLASVRATQICVAREPGSDAANLMVDGAPVATFTRAMDAHEAMKLIARSLAREPNPRMGLWRTVRWAATLSALSALVAFEIAYGITGGVHKAAFAEAQSELLQSLDGAGPSRPAGPTPAEIARMLQGRAAAPAPSAAPPAAIAVPVAPAQPTPGAAAAGVPKPPAAGLQTFGLKPN